MVSALPSLSALPGGRALRWSLASGLAAAAVLGYLALLVRHTEAHAGGSDSSGYMNHARQLREGSLHVAARTIPQLAPGHAPEYLYSPLGYRPAPDGNGLVPTYPSGLPLLIAAASFIVGWDQAANVVMIASTLAGVLLTFAAARMFGLSPRWSVVAAAIIAVSPLYLHLAIQTMSDVPALVWTTAAVLAAWLSRHRTAWAPAAGAAFESNNCILRQFAIPRALSASTLGFGA